MNTKSKNCEKCGTLFFNKNYEGGLTWALHKYCSRLCSNKIKQTNEVRNKISLSCKEKGIGKWMQGKKRSTETILKQREKMIALVKTGKHNFWKGGVSEINRTARANFQGTFMYKAFRRAVLERDDFTCQECNKRGGWLEVDHIKSYALFPKLRTEVTNGRTLCRPCHLETPNFGNKALIYI